MSIHAHTELHNDYPAFVNVSEKTTGVFTLTVRSRGNAGRNVAAIDLNQDELLKLASDIYARVAGSDSAADEEEATPKAVLAEFRRMTALLGEQVELMKESRVEHREAMARYDAMTEAYSTGSRVLSLD